MNDHNLDDLIIDNIDSKSSKSKSLLTIIALAIIVLVVAIILTKTLLKDPNEKLSINNEDSTEMISPDLTLQNTIEKELTQEKLSLNKETKAEVKNISKKENLSKIESPDTSSDKPKKETIVEKSIVEETKPKTIAITQDIFDDEVETSTEIEAKEKKHALSQAKKPVQKKATENKKQAVQKKTKQKSDVVKAKVTQKQKIKPEEASTTIQRSGHYYIQVGSFRQSPSNQFLSIIQKSGFNYKITPTSNSGTKKLLIGPYPSRMSVDSALPQVRDRINKGAFIVKK